MQAFLKLLWAWATLHYFSQGWLVLLWSTGSVTCGLQKLWYLGSAVVVPEPKSTDLVTVAHGLSCSLACGIFMDQGWNPCLIHTGWWILYYWTTREASPHYFCWGKKNMTSWPELHVSGMLSFNWLLCHFPAWEKAQAWHWIVLLWRTGDMSKGKPFFWPFSVCLFWLFCPINVMEPLFEIPRLPQRYSCLWVVVKINVLRGNGSRKLIFYHLADDISPLKHFLSIFSLLYFLQAWALSNLSFCYIIGNDIFLANYIIGRQWWYKLMGRCSEVL